MTDRIDYFDFVFDRLITCAGESSESFFSEAAFRFYDDEFLAKPFAGLTVGAVMVRCGLLLCEQRDPLIYHEFLMCLAHHAWQESDRVIDDAALGGPFIVSLEHTQGSPFLEVANKVLDEGIVDEPRTLAWALISDGLRFCEAIEADKYPNLICGLTKFLVREEIPRVENWPRLVVRPP